MPLGAVQYKTGTTKGEHVKNSDREMKAARVSAIQKRMLGRKRLVVKTHLAILYNLIF